MDALTPLTPAEQAWVDRQLDDMPEVGPKTRERLGRLFGQARSPHRDDVLRGEVRPA